MSVESQSQPTYGSANYSKLVGTPLCPDLLEYRDLGVADNARGRVIRAFFWLMRWWPL